MATGEEDVVAEAGHEVATVSVQIGPAFLQLFSEQMYSSPNKAFEELISNSWDAGASTIFVGVSDDLTMPDACAWVLDNGESMDVGGLQDLWTVAHSSKPSRQTGRPQIGKFGIGKLATYVLAHQLTYVCKPDDRILAVTMDYRRIGEQGDGLHIDPLPLAVRELNDFDLRRLLEPLPVGGEILDLVARGVPEIENLDGPSEYGGPNPPATPPRGTWTLALLTDLRDQGRAMQVGHLRRMLRAALPLGSSVGIAFNREPVVSAKADTPVSAQWILGPELDFDEIVVDDEVHKVTTADEPYPHITLEGVPGRITGSVTLYTDKISGGKSQNIGISNGFFVNILGRVINTEDPYFGLENLNHSAWARFRAAVRADGLNDSLSVNRESVIETRSVAIVRALLRTLFNRVRQEVDSTRRASWPDAGEVLKEAWGEVPFEPLRRVIAEDSVALADLPAVVNISEVEDFGAAQEQVRTEAPIAAVVFDDRPPDEALVRYDLGSRRVVLNRAHPFAVEHGATHEQQLLLRDASLVAILTDFYLAELGVPLDTLAEVDAYRDQMFRLLARLRRRAALTLVELLELVTSQSKPLETVVGDALESLGFLVRRMGGTGEPEGVAKAPLSRRSDKEAGSYSFTYDAKSSIHDRVKNNDVKVSTLVRHRRDVEADHTLVVARDFEAGALYEECRQHKVTPMRATDLGRLLMLNATRGPLDLERLRGIFDQYDPDAVERFIDELSSEHERRVTYDEFFAALAEIGYEEPDILTASVIARVMRERSGESDFPSRRDVERLVGGLSVLVPQLVRFSGERIFLGAHPGRLREAVVETLRAVPQAYRHGIGLDSGAGA